MSVPYLPPEIINCIVEDMAHLGHSIASLLLVSRSFYFPAREAVFQNVEFTFHLVCPSNERMLLLLSILGGQERGGPDTTTTGNTENSRKILAMVRSLTINFSACDQSPHYTDTIKLGQLGPQAAQFQQLLRILSRCPHIHHLTLQTRPGDVMLFDMLQLQKPILRTLIAFRCQGGSPVPSLRTFRLRDLARIPRLLVTGLVTDALTELEIMGCNAWHGRAPFYPFNARDEDDGMYLEGDWTAKIPSFSAPLSSLRHLETLIIDKPTILCGARAQNRPSSVISLRELQSPHILADSDLSSLKTIKCGGKGARMSQSACAILRAMLSRAPYLTHLSMGAQHYPAYDPYASFDSEYLASKSLTNLDLVIPIQDSSFATHFKTCLTAAYGLVSPSFRLHKFPRLQTFTTHIRICTPISKSRRLQLVPVLCQPTSKTNPALGTQLLPENVGAIALPHPKALDEMIKVFVRRWPYFKDTLATLPSLRSVVFVLSIGDGESWGDCVELCSEDMLNHFCHASGCQRLVRAFGSLREVLETARSAVGRVNVVIQLLTRRWVDVPSEYTSVDTSCLDVVDSG